MAENSHRTGRHSGAATRKRPGAKKGKPLSKVVLSAMDKNDTIVEEWLAGKSPYTYHMASVVHSLGMGVFDVNVQAPGSAGGIHRVRSRGLYRNKSGVFHDPTGGMGVAGLRHVLVQGGDLIAVMTAEQASRARARSRSRSRSRSSSRSSASSLFNRGSNAAQRERIEAVRRSLERRRRATAGRKSRSRSKSLSKSRSRSRSRSVSAASSSPEPVNWAALNASARNKMRADKLTRRKASRKAKKAAAKPWSWF